MSGLPRTAPVSICCFGVIIKSFYFHSLKCPDKDKKGQIHPPPRSGAALPNPGRSLHPPPLPLSPLFTLKEPLTDSTRGRRGGEMWVSEQETEKLSSPSSARPRRYLGSRPTLQDGSGQRRFRLLHETGRVAS